MLDFEASLESDSSIGNTTSSTGILSIRAFPTWKKHVMFKKKHYLKAVCTEIHFLIVYKNILEGLSH